MHLIAFNEIGRKACRRVFLLVVFFHVEEVLITLGWHDALHIELNGFNKKLRRYFMYGGAATSVHQPYVEAKFSLLCHFDPSVENL